MDNLNLTQSEDSIKSEIRVNQQGKGFASIRGTARLAGVDPSSLRRAFSSGAQKPSRLAEVLIAKGFDAEVQKSWSETGIPDIAVAAIVKYYACDAEQYCTEQAKLSLDVFVASGVRFWMQSMIGWQNSTVKQLQDRVAELEARQRVLPPSLDKKLDAGMILANLSTSLGDRRGMVTAQASLMNSLLPEGTPEDTIQFLSVTEVLESNGFKIPKGKDSPIGRKVAQAYREEVGEEPHTCAKHVGSGHKTANMKVYPQEFFERIVAIAQEYLN